MRPQLVDLTNNRSEEDDTMPAAYHQAMMCTKLAGKAVIRVVGRCNDAQENQKLDLSECQLMQVPEAVFHLMRHTTLKACDLSFNVVTKIPPKLGTKFNCLTELNLSNNRMSKIPDELIQLQELTKLDISFNAFVSLPKIVYSLPKLESVNAEKNHIADVDADRLKATPCLKVANFKQNPLSALTHEGLSSITSITIHLSPRELEEWEIDD